MVLRALYAMRKHHGVRFGWVRLGMVRLGPVRSCYAAFSRLIQSADRCVSIVWCGKPRFAMVMSGMVWRVQVRSGAVRSGMELLCSVQRIESVC